MPFSPQQSSEPKAKDIGVCFGIFFFCSQKINNSGSEKERKREKKSIDECQNLFIFLLPCVQIGEVKQANKRNAAR